MISYLIFFIIIVVILAIFYVFIDRRLKQLAQPQDQQSLTMLNQNIQGMQQRLDKVSDGLNTRLDNAARVIADVSKNLGQMQEIGHNMKDLQNFLKSPKLRGNIGEQILQDLLGQNFPKELFQMQYKFNNGEIVDALLKTDNGFIGIDAKFPLENFNYLMQAKSDAEQQNFQKLFIRDVKKHITAIAKKYIVPEEGTVNFAVMYIPSESVYYEIIRDDIDLNNFSNTHKVLLVSPNSFYYFLKVILMGMQGKKIEAQAQAILSTIEGIAKDSKKFGESLSVLNTHISNAKGALDRVNTDYGRLSGMIDQVKLLK
ncbi:MAG: DNA recombination protein RmuC [Patescibacteria group bacterium]|jgi:DNA recombination protein RmuC